jgi:hypothetical protein
MADVDSEREMVTIQSFRELSEGRLAEGMLNSAGIECVLVDDNTGRMLGFISDVIGGIRLQVNRADSEAAKALLEQPISEGFDSGKETNQPPRCPKCYSLDVTFREGNKPKADTGPWLSLSPPVREKVGECKLCGYRWDDEDNDLDVC